MKIQDLLDRRAMLIQIIMCQCHLPRAQRDYELLDSSELELEYVERRIALERNLPNT